LRGYQPHRTAVEDIPMIDTLPDATAATAQNPWAAAVGSMAATHHSSAVEILSTLIPIIAIVFGIGIGMLGMYLVYRKKREMFELHHKERLAAIDKGMEVPPLPPEFFLSPRKPRTPGQYLLRGLVWLLVGLAVVFCMNVGKEHDGYWGLVPAAVGVAYLVYYFIEGRRPRPAAGESVGS
jgi:hypothetical protein